MSRRQKPKGFSNDEFKQLSQIPDWDDTSLVKLIRDIPQIRQAFAEFAEWLRWREFTIVDRASLKTDDAIKRLGERRQVYAEIKRKLQSYAGEGVTNAAARRNAQR